MARQRAALSEKQERILVQCQLMGLTTADMIQISNRLKALEVERDLICEVDAVKQGCSWEPIPKGWRITARDGRIFDCKVANKTKSRSYWETTLGDWDVDITKPGTRFKPKMIIGAPLYAGDNIKKTLCPENSKELFYLLKQIHYKRWD
jgi:hypothetical protein